MTTKSLGNIRLAAGESRGDLLYNAYHLLTQLSAMYTHFNAQAQSKEHKTVFENLSVDILTDIGDLYIVWESIDKTSHAVKDNGALANRLILTCNHLYRVITLTDTWTSFVKTATLSGLLERKWLRILSALKEDAGKELAVLTELTIRAEQRMKLVTAHLEKMKIKERQTQQAFDSADLILLDRSFGF